jgi:uncharacterized membrane protein
MSTTRLEAFSDAVIAIIMTIMVLELHAPEGTELNDLLPLIPIFFSYLVSFAFLVVYWNNHHHLLHATRRVTGGILWANAHLLFWLSLIPFTTSWLSENVGATWPVALYAANLLVAAIAYTILTFTIIASQGRDSAFAKAIGPDFKGNLSLACYVLAIVMAFIAPTASYILIVFVALIWLVPDKRAERAIAAEAEKK